MKREDTYAVTAKIGTFDLSVDTFEGGDKDSEDTKYRRGGMADEESLGGSTSRGNVTVSVLYDDRVHAALPYLDAGVGRLPMTVVRQPLDIDGNPWGKPTVYTGTLKRCAPPNSDSSSSDAALIEFEQNTNGRIG